MKNIFLVLIIFFFSSGYCKAQCPDENFLWNRIVYLRDSSNVPYRQQLSELLLDANNINKCPYKNDSTHALLLLRIGWLYSMQNDFVSAIRYTRNSINLIYQNIQNRNINPTHLIKSYFNLNILYDSLKEDKLKSNAIDSCITLAIRYQTGYPYAIGLIYSRTQDLIENGDYYRAIDYADMGELITKKSGYQLQYIFYYLSWKINALISLGKYDLAEELLNKSIVENHLENNKNYLGNIYGLVARLAEQRGNYTKAIEFSRKSVNYDMMIKNYNGCASTLNNQGYYLHFRQLKQYDAALRCYNKALLFADSINALNILDNIANIYVEKEKFDSAFYFFQLAFDKIAQGTNEKTFLNDNSLLNTSIAEYLVGLILDKGDAFLKRYFASSDKKFIGEALQVYHSLNIILGKLKNIQSDINSKLFWQTANRKMYEHAIEASYLQTDETNAFYFFEKSRAVLLNDQLNQLSKISQDDILQQAQINKKISQLEKEINFADSSKKNYTKLQTELFTAKQESERIQEIIKKNNPLYYQSFLDTNFVSLNDIQKTILSKHNAFVELFNGDSAVYSLIITAQKIYLNKIDKRDYDSTTKSYISFISNSDLLNSHPLQFNKTAHHLYQLIFKNNSLPDGRIVISPDGEYFPFESLVTNNDLTSPDYFLNDHAVSYTYSARFLLNDFTSSNTSSKYNFLGMAPVNYVSAFSLSSLNGSDESLNKIENYFSGTNNFISEKASKNNFESQFSKYKIIQLYTHASDTSSNNEPVIFFADSALYLSELIPENKPSTQLIVLSACETANGQLYPGEGVFSFNRGFAALGIPSSVSNLWSVDDKSTYKLTELFYKYLAKGLPLDVALQNAKKEFIQTSSKQYSLPYYWAASVLVGKTDAIQLSNDFSWRIFLLSAAACLILFFAAKYFIRRIFFPNKKLLS